MPPVTVEDPDKVLEDEDYFMVYVTDSWVGNIKDYMDIMDNEVPNWKGEITPVEIKQLERFGKSGHKVYRDGSVTYRCIQKVSDIYHECHFLRYEFPHSAKKSIICTHIAPTKEKAIEEAEQQKYEHNGNLHEFEAYYIGKFDDVIEELDAGRLDSDEIVGFEYDWRLPASEDVDNTELQRVYDELDIDIGDGL